MENYVHKVQYYETDQMGITHHSNYIRWMEEARVDYMEKIGIGYDKMEQMGVSSPVIGVNCEYKHTTTFPDEIEITLQVKSYNGIKLVLGYEMYHAKTKQLAAFGESRHCFIGGSGKPIALQREYPELDQVFKSRLS